MTLKWYLVCDHCGTKLDTGLDNRSFLDSMLSNAAAEHQGWGFYKNAFGLRVDICPMCQIDDMEEDKDMGRAINNLLNGDNKNDSSLPS